MSSKIQPIEQHVIDVVFKLKRERNLSNKDLASVLKLTPSFVSNVENPANPCRYNLRHIGILAAYFNVSPQLFIPTSF